MRSFFFQHFIHKILFRDKIKLEFVSGAFKTSPIEITPSVVSNGFHNPQNDDEDLEGACALPLPKAEIKEIPVNVEEIVHIETSKIIELFPNYGAGYIRRLLAFYDNSSENVISKILEGLFLLNSHDIILIVAFSPNRKSRLFVQRL